jgi:CheY-like chemotaxis protein
VLISDIAMPGGDGYHLIHELRLREAAEHITPGIPAIALTAFARAADTEDALQAGFQRHITKPVDVAELTSAVVRLTRKSALGRHLEHWSTPPAPPLLPAPRDHALQRRET